MKNFGKHLKGKFSPGSSCRLLGLLLVYLCTGGPTLAFAQDSPNPSNPPERYLGSQGIQAQVPRIRVSGSASRIIAPDYIAIDFVLRTLDQDPQTSQAQNTQLYDAAQAAIAPFGIAPQDIQSRRYEVIEKVTRTWDAEQRKDISTFLGYETTNAVRILFRDIARHKELEAVLLGTGISGIVGTFGLDASTRREYELQILAWAARNARSRALALASAAQTSITQALSVEADPPRIEAAEFFAPEMLQELDGKTTTEGLQRISATVRTSFGLEPRPGAAAAQGRQPQNFSGTGGTQTRGIQVEGEASAVVAADYLNISFHFQNLAPTSQAAQIANDQIFTEIQEELAPFAIPAYYWQRKDTVFEKISVDDTSKKEQIDGYQAMCQVRISLPDISQHRTIVTRLFAAGVQDVSLAFAHTPETRETYELQILVDAFAKAKAKADLLAQSSGAQLGGLWELSTEPSLLPRPYAALSARSKGGATTFDGANAAAPLFAEGTIYLDAKVFLHFDLY